MERKGFPGCVSPKIGKLASPGSVMSLQSLWCQRKKESHTGAECVHVRECVCARECKRKIEAQ